MKNIIVGLICVMLANVLLGTSLAKLKEEFSWYKFFAGVFKGICIVVSLVLLYYAGSTNPDILVINISGVNLNIISALESIFISGIIFYSYQDINKLIKILNLKIETEEVILEPITSTPLEDYEKLLGEIDEDDIEEDE